MTTEPHDLSVSLSEKSAAFLDWLCGESLTPSEAIRALLNVAMRLDLEVLDLTSQAEMENRIWEAMRRNQFAKLQNEESGNINQNSNHIFQEGEGS